MCHKAQFSSFRTKANGDTPLIPTMGSKGQGLNSQHTPQNTPSSMNNMVSIVNILVKICCVITRRNCTKIKTTVPMTVRFMTHIPIFCFPAFGLGQAWRQVAHCHWEWGLGEGGLHSHQEGGTSHQTGTKWDICVSWLGWGEALQLPSYL